MKRYEICIGHSRPDKTGLGLVAPWEVEEWVGEVFPEGATLLAGRGFWHGITEPTSLILVYHDSDDYVLSRARLAVKRFQQEAVIVWDGTQLHVVNAGEETADTQMVESGSVSVG